MFYAFYQSVNPADHINFFTLPHNELTFPSQVMYKNKSCRLMRTYQISTPKQRTHFDNFIKTQASEVDVNIG